MWSVIHPSPLLANAVKDKTHFLVSLPTLSNQDRELHEEAVLFAGRGTSKAQDPPVLIPTPTVAKQGKATNSSAPGDVSDCQTGQVEENAQKEAKSAEMLKKSPAGVVTQRREETANTLTAARSTLCIYSKHKYTFTGNQATDALWLNLSGTTFAGPNLLCHHFNMSM